MCVRVRERACVRLNLSTDGASAGTPSETILMWLTNPVFLHTSHPYIFLIVQAIENMHRSNAEQLIDEVPPIDVEGVLAVCDGGGGALGHPLEYIQLNTVKEGEAVQCKYCSLRFRSVGGHH